MDRVAKAVKKAQSDAIKNAPERSELKQFAIASNLCNLLERKDLGSDSDQTLDEYDSEASDVLRLRAKMVEQRRDELASHDKVVKALDDAHKLGVRSGLGSRYRSAIEDYARYIVSEQFYKMRSKLSEEQNAKMLDAELARLASLDANAAQIVSVHLLAQLMDKDPAAYLMKLPEEERTKAIEMWIAAMESLNGCEPTSGSALSGSAFGDATRGGKSGLMQGVGVCQAGGSVAKGAEAMRGALATQAVRRDMAKALSRMMSNKSFYSALGDDAKAARLVEQLKNENHPRLANLFERVRKAGPYGRGLASAMSMISLFSLIGNAKWPTDADGNTKWSEVAGMAAGTLAFLSSVPTIGEFAKADLKPFLVKRVTEHFKAGRIANCAGKAVKLTQVRWLVCAKEWLGPIGDAIAIWPSFLAAREEFKNEDTVGRWTESIGLVAAGAGVASGLIALGAFLKIAVCLSLTGVGAIVGAIAALVGIVCFFLGWIFGESAMTGQIRQDLRAIGISTNEEQAFRNLTTRSVQRTQYNPYGGPSYTYTARASIPHSEIRSKAKGYTLFQKVSLINKYCEGHTSGSEEGTVYEILRVTPYTNGEFLKLVEAVDMRRVARELESDGQAANVLMWTAEAYHRAGRKPGKKFDEQFMQHCKEHREEPINKFFKEKVKKKGADGVETLDIKVYNQADASNLCESSKQLMFGNTDGSEERAIYNVLLYTDYPQFNALIGWGHDWYVRRLRDELASWQWKNVRGWMLDRDRGASATAYSLARSIR